MSETGDCSGYGWAVSGVSSSGILRRGASVSAACGCAWGCGAAFAEGGPRFGPSSWRRRRRKMLRSKGRRATIPRRRRRWPK
eukprot:3964719-Lingulodinium_polyedra.AAC.1